MSATAIRYYGAKDSDRETLLRAVDNPRVRAARSKRKPDLERYRWVKTDIESLSPYGVVQFNRPIRSTLLTVDVDNEYDHDRVADLRITPNWIGRNRINKHAQFIFYLDSPVWGTYGKYRDLFKLVTRGLIRAYGGDDHFSMGYARNPLNESEYDWDVQHHEQFGLKTLVNAIPPEVLREARESRRSSGQATQPEPTFDKDGIQRSELLWNTARFEAYRIRGNGDAVEPSDIRAVIDPVNREIISVDERSVQYDERHLQRLALRVANWCNKNVAAGTGSGAPKYAREQCVAGGEVQGQRNAENGHLDRIREVSSLTIATKAVSLTSEIVLMKEAGKTNREIAEQLGIHEGTVKRKWREYRAEQGVHLHASQLSPVRDPRDTDH